MNPPKKEVQLIIENQAKKIRLVIKDILGNELACRKTTHKEIETFLYSSTHELFKGRLQIIKKGSCIVLLLKKEPVLELTIKQLHSFINPIPA